MRVNKVERGPTRRRMDSHMGLVIETGRDG